MLKSEVIQKIILHINFRMNYLFEIWIQFLWTFSLHISMRMLELPIAINVLRINVYGNNTWNERNTSDSTRNTKPSDREADNTISAEN